MYKIWKGKKRNCPLRSCLVHKELRIKDAIAYCAVAPLSQVLPTRKSVTIPYKSHSLDFVKFPKISTKRNLSLCTKSSVSVRMENSSSAVGEKDAVIIVDHGSRRKESNLMLNDFVAMFKGRTGYSIVEPAHMELAEPSIRDAFKLCVQQGARRLIVSPFFLFPGRHWHQDIPSLAAEASKEHPGISYIVTAPLGLHELLVDVMNDRIRQCLSHIAGQANECDVCYGTGRCRVYESE